MTDKRKCVLYARISVTKEESVSVERQLDSCRRYAEARDWEVVGEFIDDGVSASSNRPEVRAGWKALLAAADYEAVVIWKVDRLARKVLDFLNADRALQDRGAGLVAVEDPIDMTTAQGRAFAVILAVFGEMEAEAIRARVKAAREHLVKQGRWAGGSLPYGYRSVEHPSGVGRWIEKDPERIGYLTRIVTEYQGGSTVNAIAELMTRIGAPRHREYKGSRPWSRQSIDFLLRNPIVAGMIRCNPGRTKGDNHSTARAVRCDEFGQPIIYPELAVITEEEFEAIQERLKNVDKPQARPRAERVRTSEFLSKVCTCDDCDIFMCRSTMQKRPVLRCPECSQHLSRTQFDPWLVNQLLDRTGDLPMGAATIRAHWPIIADEQRRSILLEHVESIRVRRGKVGARLDVSRFLITWRVEAEEERRAAS